MGLWVALTFLLRSTIFTHKNEEQIIIIQDWQTLIPV